LRDWGSVAAIAGSPRTTRVYTAAHMLDILKRQRALNYPPGAAYSYSNSGYNLAAVVVERVAGKSLAEFTREAIFVPLGMSGATTSDAS
jgi:CubicO group peptidase (beta-lactamase class C family)